MDSLKDTLDNNILFHKEKNQKKNNKTKGQVDNLKKYANRDTLASDKLTTSESQIKREANYIKNIHIDTCYDKLRERNLITDDNYREWWCGPVMQTLGCEFVMAQADRAMKAARDQSRPAGLFHFLINKEMNKRNDPYMPRFNRTERSDS